MLCKIVAVKRQSRNAYDNLTLTVEVDKPYEPKKPEKIWFNEVSLFRERLAEYKKELKVFTKDIKTFGELRVGEIEVKEVG
jgi:hypothetical protein